MADHTYYKLGKGVLSEGRSFSSLKSRQGSLLLVLVAERSQYQLRELEFIWTANMSSVTATIRVDWA